MNKLILVAVFTIGIIGPVNLYSQDEEVYREQDMCFTSSRNDSAVLCGTLAIPDNFKTNGHIIVLVTSPGPIDRTTLALTKLWLTI